MSPPTAPPTDIPSSPPAGPPLAPARDFFTGRAELIAPTASAASLAGRVDPLYSESSFVPQAQTPEEEQLIGTATELKDLISVQFNSRTPSGEDIYLPSLYLLIIRLESFVDFLQSVKNPEKTLDAILPHIQEEDKWIFYKYLDKKSCEKIGSIEDLVFKKIKDNLNPDLTKIENLLPIFKYPIDQQEWRHLFPLLQKFASSGGESRASAASDIPSFEVQVVILTALNQAVKSKNPEAISFLLTTFPFIKNPVIAQEKYFSLNFVDSEKIQHYNSFDNPFYSACKSGDLRCVEAFLLAGWDLRKKAGAGIIKELLLTRKYCYIPTTRKIPFTEEDLANKMAIFQLLLTHGLDPELNIEGTSGMQSTMGETLFLDADPEVKKFGLYLFENGAKLTPRVVEKMKLELGEHPEYEQTVIRLLIEQRKASVDEIRCLMALPAPIGSRDALMGAMSSAKTIINQLLRRYTGNPLIEDFKELEGIRALKKEVKKCIAAHPEDESLRGLYQSFSFEYDALVTNHYLLSKLRQVSQELRGYVNPTSGQAGAAAGATASAKTSLSRRVVALFNLWHPVAPLTGDGALKLISSLDATTRSANFQIIRSNLLKYVAEFNAESFWRDKHVSCVHGTKLVPDMVKERALIPAGMMADDAEGATVQFSGEQCGSKKLHNKEHISCVRPAKDWGDLEETHRLQGVPTPMLISEVYAKQISGYGRVETGFDFEASKNRANWGYIAAAVFGDDTISERSLQQCCTHILRLRAWDPSHGEYLTPLLTKVTEALESATTPPWQLEALQELAQALTVRIKFPLDASDRDLISHPIPIMFASTNFPPIPTSQVMDWETQTDEVFIKGRANFGKDLQASFVDEDLIDRARALLQPHGLRVFPFQIAHALETDRMMRGAHIQERSQSLISDQATLGILLQEDILPAYGRPLAERPSYIDATGVENFVDRPFWGTEFRSYTDYKQAIEETTTLPRSIHGKMHAVRTSMAAQLWANVYGAMKQETVAPDRKLLALALSLMCSVLYTMPMF
ncbi:MAG: hypothetical protein NTX49_03695 [Chlamydiae bacterium]|nr:hypothetical protein [Chlamydiota bacterium]